MTLLRTLLRWLSSLLSPGAWQEQRVRTLEARLDRLSYQHDQLVTACKALEAQTRTRHNALSKAYGGLRRDMHAVTLRVADAGMREEPEPFEDDESTTVLDEVDLLIRRRV